MKLLQAIQWLLAHQDVVFMFVGEAVAACWALVIAIRPLIKVFAKLADITDAKWDNAAVQAVSNFFDYLAASLDRIRRVLPVHFGPPTSVQPITTKDSRATAWMLPPEPLSPMAPLESKRPPPAVATLPAPTVVTGLTEETLQRDTIPEERP